MLSVASAAVRHFKNLERHEVRAMFSSVPRNDAGLLDFHEMQR